MKRSLQFFALLLAITITGCASTEGARSVDPLESVNRKVYAFNSVVDKIILKPVAQGYVFIAPDFVEKGVSNFFSNLFYPNVIVNQFLQGKVEHSVKDTGRLVVNSTIGILGLLDVATRLGLEKHEEDFGQTLAVWGVGQGPYLVVPFLGSYTLRNGVGSIADAFANPIGYIDNDVPTRNRLWAGAVLNQRANLLEAETLLTGDKYLFTRDAYLQNRDYLIRDGEVSDEDSFLSDIE